MVWHETWDGTELELLFELAVAGGAPTSVETVILVSRDDGVTSSYHMSLDWVSAGVASLRTTILSTPVAAPGLGLVAPALQRAGHPDRPGVHVLCAEQADGRGRCEHLARDRDGVGGLMGRRRGRRIFGGGGARPLQNPACALDYDLPATYNKTYADIVAATAAQFGALPALGWRAGDGNVPSHWLGAVNAAVRLNNGGAITAMLSPYQDVAGVDIPSEHHLAGYRGTLAAGVLDPAAGDDFYVAMLLKYPDREVGGAQALLGNTIGAGRGFAIYSDAAGLTSFLCIGAAAATVQVPGIFSAWVLLQAIYDANGNIRLCLGGTESIVAAPAGDVFPSLLPMQIFSSVFPTQNAEVAWAIYQHGAGLADLSTLAFRTSLVQLTSGLCPRIGTPGAFTRASAAAGIDDNGRHFIVQTGRPRAGDPAGGRLAPSRVNKCYRNINPANTTACGVSGGVLSVVADAARLIADGCDCWGPNVYQMVPGAADRVVICGAATANTNAHSLQVLIRGAAGGETVTPACEIHPTGLALPAP